MKSACIKVPARLGSAQPFKALTFYICRAPSPARLHSQARGALLPDGWKLLTDAVHFQAGIVGS